MRQRVERTQEALEVSEAARADLRRRLDEAVDAEAKAGLRADLEESITQLDRVRTYHLRLKSTLTRRILSSTIANLEEQLRLTAGDLQRAAAERDRLSAEVAALRSTTSSEDSTNLADAERRRIEAEQRAIAAEARNAELEVELEYAASRISGLGGDSESPNIDRTEIERAPAIEAPLVNSELRLQQGSEPPPATPAATSTDLSDAAGRSAADSAARSAAAAIPEVRSEATGPATQVEEIAWQEDDGSIVFYISLDGRVSKEDCNVVRVRSGVPRDVLKVQGLRKNLSPSMIDVQTGSVVRLRTGVHRSGDQSEMHIVVDLTHADAAIRTVRIRGNILVVTIN
jgi:hypothetical protein